MCQCMNRCGVSTHAPRILLSLMFVIGGIGFLMNFAGTQKMVAMALAPWGLASIALIATVIAIILKLGGGLMFLFNYKTSTAAWMLIIFTAIATLLFHTQWGGDGGQMQITQFLKNLGVIGGLMLFAKCYCKTCKAAGDCKNGTCCKKSE